LQLKALAHAPTRPQIDRTLDSEGDIRIGKTKQENQMLARQETRRRTRPPPATLPTPLATTPGGRCGNGNAGWFARKNLARQRKIGGKDAANATLIGQVARHGTKTAPHSSFLATAHLQFVDLWQPLWCQAQHV